MMQADARFACAFVATSYVLGERQAPLAPGLLGEEVQRLTAVLQSPERAERARALAVELSRIAVTLEQGALR